MLFVGMLCDRIFKIKFRIYYFIIIHCIKFMSAQYVRPVYQVGELIDSYEINLAALVQHSSDRFIFGSIAHNREATVTSYGAD